MNNWKRTREDLIQAILDRDIDRVGKIADQMRFEGKLNYDQSFAVAHNLTGIDEQEWDSMLYEADERALRHYDTANSRYLGVTLPFKN